MTFTIITQFESARTTFNTVTSMDNQTVEVTQEGSVVQSQDSFDLSNNFTSSSSNDVSNSNQNYEQQQLENASSPSSPRGITKKKRKNSKNTFIDFPSVITTVSNNNSQVATQQQSQHQDDMWMQGVLFQFKNACLCSSYSSSYSIKQKKPNNPTGVLVSNRRTI